MGVYQNNDGNLSLIAGGTLYSDSPVGSIVPFGGSTIPSGWLLCDGSIVSRTVYKDLFNVIGTAFGAGDGSTTFNLPDLRETVPVGSGTRGSEVTAHDTYTLGEFKDDQLQNHKHNIKITSDISQTYTASSGNKGSGDVLTSTGRWDSSASNPYTYTKSISVNGTSSDPTTGRSGSTTHGKQLGVNYIIKAKQIALPLDISKKMSYSTDEIDTGKTWIDGKKIYRKVVDCGALPNNTTKSVPHGISNLSYVVELKGMAIYSDGTTFMSLPQPHPANVVSAVFLYVAGANICLRTGANLTDWTNSKVTIEYTKTTDA